ncbi:MAG TPA: hypothetical protein VFK88_12970 [Gallionella sp.]|nr:hypothetical protein [Gallionella sp.]
MPVRTWRLITIMFTALSMGMAFSHLLELPAKMTYDAALWLMLQHTLYGAFGLIGAVIEVSAVLTAAILAILVQKRRLAFGWTLLGALCLAAGHAAWWIWVAPVNDVIAPLTRATLPADWENLRNQWEYTHAAHAVLQIIALGALVFSILVEGSPDASSNPPA